MMIIEFTGLPAAGKTYISKLLVNYLKINSKHKPVIYDYNDLYFLRNKKYKNKVALIFKYLILSCKPMNFKIIIKIFRLKSCLSEKVLAVKMYFNTLIIYKIINAIKKGKQKVIFILHEGYIHCLFTLYVTPFNSPYKNEIKKYINHKIGINLLVFIQCSPDISLFRLEKRGWFTRIRKYSKQKKLEFIKRFETTSKIMLKNIKLFEALVIENENFRNSNEYTPEFEKINDFIDCFFKTHQYREAVPRE